MMRHTLLGLLWATVGFSACTHTQTSPQPIIVRETPAIPTEPFIDRRPAPSQLAHSESEPKNPSR